MEWYYWVLIILGFLWYCLLTFYTAEFLQQKFEGIDNKYYSMVILILPITIFVFIALCRSGSSFRLRNSSNSN